MTWIKTRRVEQSPVFKSECKGMKLLPGAQWGIDIRGRASELGGRGEGLKEGRSRGRKDVQ